MRHPGLASRLLMALGLTLPGLAAAGLESDAKEILQRRCVACHGPKRKTAGLDLSSREWAFGGGGKDPAVKPGSPSQRFLLDRVLKGQMPPTGPLPAPEADTLRRWIEAGAPWAI